MAANLMQVKCPWFRFRGADWGERSISRALACRFTSGSAMLLESLTSCCKNQAAHLIISKRRKALREGAGGGGGEEMRERVGVRLDWNHSARGILCICLHCCSKMQDIFHLLTVYWIVWWLKNIFILKTADQHPFKHLYNFNAHSTCQSLSLFLLINWEWSRFLFGHLPLQLQCM